MDLDCTIRKYFLDKEESKWMYVLAGSGEKSFIDKCIDKDPHRARRIVTTIERVFDRGIEWGFASSTIKRLKGISGDVAVFETRVNGSVVRVATYLHEGDIPIYLFDFDSHSGSRNNIPGHVLRRAADAAKRAESCAGSYDFEEYEVHRK